MASRNPRVFLWPKDNTAQRENQLQVVKLRHPRTRTAAMFLMNSKSDLQEIVNFGDGHRSWFLDNSVVSDKSSMTICTPLDKVFLLIPYLEKSENFTPLPDLISDEDFPANHEVFDDKTALENVADKKEAAGFTVYRFNKEKALMWLMKKVESVISVLKEKNLDISTGSFSANFKDSNATFTDDSYMSYAHGIVSEYISSDLAQDLRLACGISDQSESTKTPKKRESDQPKTEPQSKRVKQGSPEEPSEDYSKFGAQANTNAKSDTSKMTTAQKKLMNSSKKGMKNIQSFFGKPK